MDKMISSTHTNAGAGRVESMEQRSHISRNTPLAHYPLCPQITAPFDRRCSSAPSLPRCIDISTLSLHRLSALRYFESGTASPHRFRSSLLSSSSLQVFVTSHTQRVNYSISIS